MEWRPEGVDSSGAGREEALWRVLAGRGVDALKAAGRGVLDFALPPMCPVCERCVQGQPLLCDQCWPDLKLLSPPWCDRLGIPLHYDLGEDGWSAAALADPPLFDRARAAALYEGPARDLIHAFKFRRHYKLSHLLAPIMLRAAREVVGDAGVLVPVPLHSARLRQRGYNQAALLAQEIGKQMEREVVPDGLVRLRRTRQQVGLTREDRRANVRDAFALSERFGFSVAGAHMVLVDDVLTTGATANECARLLKEAGAAQVDVLVFALVDPTHTESETDLSVL